ncbi:GNAT family N-acetyltransferase [Brevundimonas sp. 2R-24]|uniref:GNAT family N-acetyltransferase n=1 Tax=Peiella sedimenti TaxID=3061083 RepID=A0ABT8SNV1_9CAUL|nr:GNAT family N-acetyltransferase [Caulobacteraceae bacterium XZ-24]
MEPPVLSTPRLILRPHAVSDFDDLHRLWSHPVVSQAIGLPTPRPDETWSRLLRYAGGWRLLGFGMFAVTDRASGAFIGDMGLFEARRPLTPGFGGAPEAGWALLPEHHGKGLASEALSAVLAWADARGVERTACMITPDNPASLRTAARAGYVEYARTTFHEAEVALLERRRPG